MCRLSAYDDDRYRRTVGKPARSLFAWARDLWRQRRPETAEDTVVPFPVESADSSRGKADPRASKAA
jgi:hypothetical protein